MGEKIEKLAKVGLLYELLDKCQEMVQSESLAGGHKGSIDNHLQLIKDSVLFEIELLKRDITK